MLLGARSPALHPCPAHCICLFAIQSFQDTASFNSPRLVHISFLRFMVSIGTYFLHLYLFKASCPDLGQICTPKSLYLDPLWLLSFGHNKFVYLNGVQIHRTNPHRVGSIAPKLGMECTYIACTSLFRSPTQGFINPNNKICPSAKKQVFSVLLLLNSTLYRFDKSIQIEAS